MGYLPLLMTSILLFGWWTLSWTMKSDAQHADDLVLRAKNCKISLEKKERIRLPCDSGSENNFGKCYRFFAKAERWLRANESCASYNASLAVPQNETMRIYFVSLLRQYPPLQIDLASSGWFKEPLFKPNSMAVGFYYDFIKRVWMTNILGRTLRQNKYPKVWAPYRMKPVWFAAAPAFGYLGRDGIFHNYNGFILAPYICEKEEYQ